MYKSDAILALAKRCDNEKRLPVLVLYTSASREKVKQNFIPIFNQKLGIRVIHECVLYSHKYGTRVILSKNVYS